MEPSLESVDRQSMHSLAFETVCTQIRAGTSTPRYERPNLVEGTPHQAYQARGSCNAAWFAPKGPGGFERSFHGRPAGFRTHTLVCLALSLLMLVTLYQWKWLPGVPLDTIRTDPTRMAQGTVPFSVQTLPPCPVPARFPAGDCIWQYARSGTPNRF
jgi:MgtC family